MRGIIIIVCLIRSRRFMRESAERSGISGFLMWHLVANLSIRELITDAREKSIGSQGCCFLQVSLQVLSEFHRQNPYRWPYVHPSKFLHP